MNRILTAALTLSLALSLTACGDSGANPTPSPADPAPTSAADVTAGPQPTAATPAQVDCYAFSPKEGVTLSIDQDMAEILEALGEPQSYFEAASCAFEGLDKTYTYPGFQITTRPDGEKDYVNSILLTDDSVTTPEGIYIGSSAADVTAAYGDSESGSPAALTYVKDGITLSFILEGNAVISIEYFAA